MKLSILRTAFSAAPFDWCEYFGLFSTMGLSPRLARTPSTCLDGRLIVRLEQHFSQTPRVEVGQHAVDGEGLRSFAEYLAGSHCAVGLWTSTKIVAQSASVLRPRKP